MVVVVVVLDVVVDVAYVPLLDVVVPVDEAVDGKSAEPVVTGEFDFLVYVGDNNCVYEQILIQTYFHLMQLNLEPC